MGNLKKLDSGFRRNDEEGEPYGVKSPTDVGTGKAKDERAPLSEIIEILNARFGTDFTEEDRLFFEQIKEKAANHEHVIQTALANPLDKFQLGIKKLIEDLMIQRMTDNDKIVTRYMEDQDFSVVITKIKDGPMKPILSKIDAGW